MTDNVIKLPNNKPWTTPEMFSDLSEMTSAGGDFEGKKAVVILFDNDTVHMVHTFDVGAGEAFWNLHQAAHMLLEGE